VGLFFSVLLKQSGLALLSSYVLIVVLVLGSQLISSSIVSAINSDNSRFPAGATRPDTRIDPAFDLPKRILVLNPLAAVGSVISPNAPYRLNATEDLKYFPASTLFGGNPATYFRQVPGPQNAQANAISRLPVLPNGWALWGGYVLIYSGITGLFLILSTTVVKIGRMEKGIFNRNKQKKARQKKDTAIKFKQTSTGA
jgi:hypothetical protein